MRRILGSNIHNLFLLILLSCATPMAHGMSWTDGNTPDVTDVNLSLDDANITLGQTPVTIYADTADVSVTMGQDTVISGFASGNSRLIIRTEANRTVTFNLTNNLTFQGSQFGASDPTDLLIVIYGPGNVVFNFDGGTSLTLTRNLTGGVGGTVQMYVRQGTAAPAVGGSQLTFTRSGVNPSDNVETIVEQGAILSYIGFTAQPSAPADEIAAITWDPGAGSGRMILTIGDTGAVIIRGRLADDSSTGITLSNIDSAIPAGFNALFHTLADTQGSLLIQNYNNTLGEFIWDPWGNLDVRGNPPFGNFSGTQYGFIVGSYGTLEVRDSSYIDYIGLTGVQCPTPPIADASAQVKARSASALFTDGQPDPDFVSPVITIGDNAGLYFRSGVDNEGNIRSLTDPNPFTIDPALRTPGAGFPVFDIEGPLLINGAGAAVSAFQLLSLEVDPTGGPLITGESQTIFPLRTFNTISYTDPCTGVTEDVYLSYNNASFLNNGRVNLCTVSWVHTDQNHHVFENNDVSSEPAYVGGETWKIIPCITRPKWAFANSNFHVQMSVALTGVDLLTPENSFCDDAGCVDNQSSFIFYQNGYAVDNGSGRNMILGTLIGSTACDGCTVVSKDSHLDVMQTATCDGGADVLHELILSTTQNNHDIVEAIPVGADLSNQYSIQTIYLGNSSNISIGTNGDEGTSAEATLTTQYNFPLTTFPELLINGNFFSFETRGGENGIPATSNVTGQGGIFVDMNGTISIGSNVCGYRTNIGAMVTRSRNGVINLPKNRVFFDPTVGIATWNVNLNDPSQVVIVPQGASYSDYNLNWMFTEKDYDVFTPYEVNCYDACVVPEVTSANITDIPTVEGFVQQFQLQGSRIGDVAHLKVRGGTIQELVMLVGCNSAEAPVAVLVLEDSALVGLGSTHRNVDSLNASIQLGVNGINLILNGDQATINLNEDVIINNTCSIIPGPDITEDAILRFRSDCCTTLRVTADGILDLSAFTTGQTVEFGGNVRVVFEPGATVIHGAPLFGDGPTLRFADEATCYFEPQVNLNGIFTTDLTGTDTIRVTFSNQGIIEFADCARADLPRDAFVGVESLILCNVFGADIRLRITDNAQFHIGDAECGTPGGVFQVGNSIDLGDPRITFSLILDGPQATFEVGPQGFLGLGTGIVDKPAAGHNDWLIAPTANVQKVSLDLRNGIFKHSQLYAGSDPDSALIAVSDSVNGNVLNQGFDFYADPLPGQVPTVYSGPLLSNTTILGGGNLIAVNSATAPFNPVVGTVNGTINAGQYAAGILASMPIIQEPVIQDVDAFSLQLLLRVQNVLDLAPTTNRGVAASSNLRNQVRVGYVDTAGVPASEGLIARAEIRNIVGKTPQTEVQEHVLELGAVQVSLTPLEDGFPAPRPIIRVIEIGN